MRTKKLFWLILFVSLATVFLRGITYSEDRFSGKKESEVKVQTPVAGWVIVPPGCRTCNPGPVVEQLKGLFPNLELQMIFSTSAFARELIAQFKIAMLPAYIFSKAIDQEAQFGSLSAAVTLAGDKYYLSPASSGVSFMPGRPVDPGRLDLFVFLTKKETLPVLKMLPGLMSQKERKIRLYVHFIGLRDAKTREVLSPAGRRELEEDQIYACVERYYPQKAWDYLTCRMANTESLYWEDCLDPKAGAAKVRRCARGEEGRRLFLEKIKLAEEIKMLYGPLFLLDNVEIFGVTPETTLQDILKVIQ